MPKAILFRYSVVRIKLVVHVTLTAGQVLWTGGISDMEHHTGQLSVNELQVPQSTQLRALRGERKKNVLNVT